MYASCWKYSCKYSCQKIDPESNQGAVSDLQKIQEQRNIAMSPQGCSWQDSDLGNTTEQMIQFQKINCKQNER